ncbi:MAG: 7-cyano-7-deazaguanine synthase QueC [Thermodesulfovibrionia bacterium]|nr:7-cyano-7-deazaguanine synthase QueC [Thermodesulfovibrionia bacterium]
MTGKRKPAVVLLSGGIDSTTTLYIAKALGFDLYAITFNYGQRHSIELSMARLCAERLDVRKHLVLDIDLRQIGGSALTSDMEVPKAVNSQEQAQSQIPVTYVPARNTIFLSLALAWAEVIGSEDIFIGANAVDYSGYPDCRPEFIHAFENMANLATKASVEGSLRYKIHVPLIDMTKAGIIRKGAELGVDHSLAWSCYDPEMRNGKYLPCLRCDSCVLRIKGFKEAGISDPLSDA